VTIPDWVSHDAVLTFAILAGPALAVCLILGVIGSILQTTTQIREAALGFVPKVLGLMMLILLGGGLMFSAASAYATHIFKAVPGIIHVNHTQ
jgi:flagellar biosynthesis protein FliQ